MSRGLGRWQRFLLDSLADGDWHEIGCLVDASTRAHPLDETAFSDWLDAAISRRSAVLRAARTLKNRGLVTRRRVQTYTNPYKASYSFELRLSVADR
jgi:hypothetical protein